MVKWHKVPAFLLENILTEFIEAETRDEELQAFDDLQCFVDDPETHDEYFEEWIIRDKRNKLIRELDKILEED